MKTLILISALVSMAYSFLSDDMKAAAVSNHAASSIERTAKFNP
jgi:hypothetical protein